MTRAGDDPTYGFCNSCGEELMEGEDCCEDGEWEPALDPLEDANGYSRSDLLFGGNW